jgi:glycosyltransferase involved in cell wall biosynthesis
LLLDSDLARRTSMRLFDNRRPHDPGRPWHERFFYMLGMLRAFDRELRAHPPDLVHLKTSSGVNFHQNALYARAARRRGLPVVLQIHSGRFEAFHRESPALLRPFIRRTLEGATRVVALSRGWADRIAAIAPAARVAVVPNGLDDAELALLGRGGEIRRPRVLFLGTGSAALNRDKGLEDLLAVLPAAARRHPDVRWVLAGLEHPEPIRTRLLDAGVPDAGLPDAGAHGPGLPDAGLPGAPEGPTVSCLGRVTGDERAALLTGSTILVLPSRFENMPNVLLEAMAAGLGVVATDVGAMPEMLGYGEGGVLIPAGDRIALAAALDGLLASPALVRSQGRRNRQAAARAYTMRVVERRLEEVYRDAASWPAGAPDQSTAAEAPDAAGMPGPTIQFPARPAAKL